MCREVTISQQLYYFQGTNLVQPYTPFHGSYQPGDVEFLLQPIAIAYTEVAEKEKLIQAGRKHYSELLSPEYQPSPRYLDVFHAAMQRNRQRLARDLLALAAQLSQRENLVLVSLARAGTPVGVLLRRALRQFWGMDAPHYSVSIIRDRGIDTQALRHILARHDPLGRDMVFIDGWTGKGVIATELQYWVGRFNAAAGTQIPTGLAVLADISGHAALAATQDDYLIPSALLNSTISGLVSRSVWNEQISENEFHGCKFFGELAGEDLSLWYIGQILQEAEAIYADAFPSTGSGNAENAALPPCVSAEATARRQAEARAALQGLMAEYRVSHVNYFKPGVGEAIRVLLRRAPQRVLLRDKTLPEMQPFVVLAAEKNVPLQERPDMPWLAAGIIAHGD